MNNKEVEMSLSDCESELASIRKIVDKDPLDESVNYLNKYSIIKACGTIEFAFKSIISDFCTRGTMVHQVRNFISKMIVNGSLNPTIDNMCKFLNMFDEQWNNNFKVFINNDIDKDRLLLSLTSLNEARNQFAHGRNSSSTIHNIELYFKHAVQIIKYLDNIVN